MNTYIFGHEENPPPFISYGSVEMGYGAGKTLKKYLNIFFNLKKYACALYVSDDIYTFLILQKAKNRRTESIEEKTTSIGNEGGPLLFQVEVGGKI